MNDIGLNCPTCGQRVSVDEAARGSELKCPTCDGTISVPQLTCPQPLSSIPEGWVQSRATSDRNAWRSGDRIIVKRGARPTDQHCVDCGVQSETYETLKLGWLETSKVIMLFIFPGPILAPLVFMALSKKATIELPMCAKCRRARSLANRVTVFSIVGGFAAIGSAIAANAALHTETFGQILGPLEALLLLVGIGTALVVKTGLKTTRIDETSVWLQIRGSRYASRLPTWRE